MNTAPDGYRAGLKPAPMEFVRDGAMIPITSDRRSPLQFIVSVIENAVGRLQAAQANTGIIRIDALAAD